MKRWHVTLVVVLALIGALALGYLGPARRAVQRTYWRAHGALTHEAPTVATWTVERPMAVKTQTVDGAGHVTGTISLQNLGTPLHDESPVALCAASAGGIRCGFYECTLGWGGPDPQPDPPEGTTYTFAVFIDVGGTGNSGPTNGVHSFVYVGEDLGWEASGSFDISLSGRELWRDRTSEATHGRNGAPVYGVETHAEDSWVTVHPVSWAATFAGLSLSGTQTWDESMGEWVPITVGAIAGVQADFSMMSSNALEYARVTFAWDGVALNFSGRSETVEGGLYKLIGDGSAVYLIGLVSNDADPHDCYTVAHLSPMLADFSEAFIRDRNAGLLGDVQVSGGFTATPRVPASMTWLTSSGDPPDAGDTVYPTITELRAAGPLLCNGASLISGLTIDDPDYAYDLHGSAVFSLSILAASARAEAILDTDLTLEQRIPGVDNSTCDTGATIDYDMLSFSHRNGVGVYGPTPAHDHTDWTGTGGVATPDGAGDFAVTGAGALTLLPASDYDDRLARVPGMTAPEGVPMVYWYRRADTYYPADGDPEAVYCWLGWAWLSIPLTAADACELTLTVSGRRYTHTDTHLSDSTRQEDYEVATTDTDYTYVFAVAAGAQTVLLNLIGPAEDVHPILERVTSIALSGFASGDWTIGEPTLVLKAGANAHCSVKNFEGYEYHKGGFSCHADSAFEYGAGDTDHSNLQEWTVPLFDYTEGATSGFDLTTAWSLASFAAIIQATSDAFTCAINASAHEDATKDDEDPPNQLSTWGFDLCAPFGGATPPEQSADGGTLNGSIRCGSWTITSGIVYAIRTDKVVHGRGHGRVSDEDGAIVPDAGLLGIYLWKREAGTVPWTLVEELSGDEHGHWTSTTLSELSRYDGTTAIRWQYGTGATAETVTVLGFAYTREWLAESILTGTPAEPYIDIDECGLTWLVTEATGQLRVYYRDARETPPQIAVTRPTLGAGYERPSIAVRGGQLLVAATETAAGNTVLWSSLDRGETWEAVATDLGTGITLGTIAVRPGTGEVLLTGIDASDNVVLRMASGTDLPRDDLTPGVDEITITAVAAGARSTCQAHPDGSLIAAVEGTSGVDFFRCRTLTTGFAAV